MSQRRTHFCRAILCGFLVFVLALALSCLLLKLQGKPTYLDRVPELIRTYLGREDTEDRALTVFQSPRELAQKSIPHFESRWMLQNLNDDDLRNFVALYRYAEDAIFKGESREWVLLPVPTSYDKAEQLVGILRAECPELVTLNRRENLIWHYKDANGLISLSLPVLTDGKEMLEACEKVIGTLKEQTAGLTATEKERFVYDYLTNSTVYDMESIWAGSPYGALVEGRAKCDGVSLAFKWIMEEMEIPCLTVTAHPQEGEGHAWNMVCLNDVWYTVDITMDMIHEEDTEPHENGYYVFNASTKWAKRDLILDDFGVPLPEADTMNDSWHVQNGSFLRNEEEAVIRLNRALFEILHGRTDELRILFQFQKSVDMTMFLSDLETLINEAMSRSECAGNIVSGYHIATMEEYCTVALTLEME